MRTTIDKAGRIVVPKPLRDELGFEPGSELEVEAVDGRLEVSFPTQVWVEEAPNGPVLKAPPGTPPLTAEQVRELVERSRP